MRRVVTVLIPFQVVSDAESDEAAILEAADILSNEDVALATFIDWDGIPERKNWVVTNEED